MLFLLSPAQALDYQTPLPPGLPHTLPQFAAQAAQLIEKLRQLSPQQVASLMGLSDKLAALNVARYEAWSPVFTASNSRQAVMAFDGDVYGGLQARTLSAEQLAWAQERLCILSGLYGVLRPLDWMQPYRLEMGARLVTDAGGNLYQFWGSRIAQYLNERLAQEGEAEPVVVNLASQEYFRAVDQKALRARVVTCVFQQYRGGQYRVGPCNGRPPRLKPCGALTKRAMRWMLPLPVPASWCFAASLHSPISWPNFMANRPQVPVEWAQAAIKNRVTGAFFHARPLSPDRTRRRAGGHLAGQGHALP